MKLLSRIDIPGKPGKAIELLQGDLTTPDAQHPIDLLVVSAFPDDYLPTPNSLIGALHRKGVSVAQLAGVKALDLRAHFSCWLSQDITSIGLGFKRLLCFEPLVRGIPPDVVGDIFRALMPILGDHAELRSLAMPVVAAGDASWPLPVMLEPLFDAAIHWMMIGLPLDVVKVVVRAQASADEATLIFEAWRKKSPPVPPLPTVVGAPHKFDVFVSYAHQDADLAAAFSQALAAKSPTTRQFLDRQSIAIGMAWQPAIFESLDHCRKVVALMSPSYLASKVCKEEFNIAWARSRDSEQDILFPVYLYSASLPTYMTYRNYFDCREGRPDRIAQACDTLLQALQSTR